MLGPEADDEWQDMPIERSDQGLGAPFESVEGESSGDEGGEAPSTSADRVARGLRVQQARRAHLYSSPRGETRRVRNITGRHLDVHDVRGFDWREKPSDLDPSAAEGKKDAELAYTQLRLDEDEEEEDLNAATEYLFHEDLAQIEHGDDPSATPISQLAMTKKLLSEPQKIAYVGLCSITAHNMLRLLHAMDPKDTRGACRSGNEWLIRVMVRLYQHLDIDVREQSMIESLSEHGILASDLAGSLITTHTIANPAYDPNEARQAREAEEAKAAKEAKEAEERKKAEDEARALRESEDAKEARKAQEAWEAKGDARASWDPSKEPSESLDAGTPSQQEAPEQAEAREPQDAQGGTPEKRSEDQAPAPPKDAQPPHTPTQGSATSPRSKPRQGTPHAPAEDTSSSQPSVLVDPNTAAQVAGGADASPTGHRATAPASSVSGPGRTYPQSAEAPRTTLEGVTTEMSASNKTLTLDLRWTVLCDLFLVLTADSVYDARSRVLLERVAEALGLTSMDVTKFEKRITDTLQIEEDVQALEDRQIFSKHERARRNKRLAMMGLATVGGGLVIGLSAGLLAPLIGAGMGSALATIGIGSVAGNSLIFGGVGGATVITTTGTLSGATLGARGMQRRTRNVKTFEFRPIHNHKRVNCIVTVPGFLRGSDDDPTLPFGVLDSVMGDAFSIMWEPEMMQEMGNAMSILWNETLVQGMQQVLAATVAPAMFSGTCGLSTGYTDLCSARLAAVADQARVPDRQPVVQRTGALPGGWSDPCGCAAEPAAGCASNHPGWLQSRRPDDLLRAPGACPGEGIWRGAGRVPHGSASLGAGTGLVSGTQCGVWAVCECVFPHGLDSELPAPGHLRRPGLDRRAAPRHRSVRNRECGRDTPGARAPCLPLTHPARAERSRL